MSDHTGAEVQTRTQVGGLATSLVTRRPKPDRIAEFEEVLSNTISAAVGFPGQLGITVLKPSESGASGYRIVVKFESERSLQEWQQSPVAAEWFAKLAALEQGPAVFEQVTGLEAWFELPPNAGEVAHVHAPGRHKMAFAAWLGSFPTITALIWLLWPVIGTWPLVVRSAILSALMAILLTYFVMPQLARGLSRWLYAPRGPRS
ncbi:MAG: antibiotic biosynthesis monooxygenase [Candidatus Binatia bacterium]